MVGRQPPELPGGPRWYESLEAIVGAGDIDWRCCVAQRTACRAGFPRKTHSSSSRLPHGPIQQPTGDTGSLANDCVYWLG